MVIDTISVMSCQREPSYLSKTLSTIPSDLKVEIFYQGDVSTLQIDNVEIYPTKFIDDPTFVHKNSQFNYASILLRTKCGVIVEDDVFFSPGFLEHLGTILDIISSRSLQIEDYAVALYSCYSWGREDLDIVPYPVDDFYGTQAMLYNVKTAREFGHFLMGRVGREPYDLALKSFIADNPMTNLFASTRSLVQHIGESTSGLGFFHQTNNFID